MAILVVTQTSGANTILSRTSNTLNTKHETRKCAHSDTRNEVAVPTT